MLASDILQRHRSQMPSFDMSEEGQLDEVDRLNAAKMQAAQIAKRRAAAGMQSERSAAGMFPAGTLTASGAPSALPSPAADWWRANEEQRLAIPTGEATPGGARFMGSGNTEQTAADVLAALTSRRSAPMAGGGTSAGGARGGGEITYSPGGNYSRGPAMDESDLERLKQDRAKTAILEQSVPQAATDRARSNALFNIGTNTDKLLNAREGELKTDTARQDAARYWDPAVYSVMESKQRLATEAGEPEREIAGLKMKYDLAGKQATADATMRAAEMKGQAAQLVSILSNLRQAAAAKAQNMTFGANADQVKALDEAIEYLKQFGTPQISLPGLIK